MFPSKSTKKVNRRLVYDETTTLIIPGYLKKFLADLAHPQKIDAIKILRLILPGTGLWEAKVAIELMTQEVSPGRSSSTGKIADMEYSSTEDWWVITFSDQGKGENIPDEAVVTISTGYGLPNFEDPKEE